MKSITPFSKIKSEFSLQNATSFGGIKVFLEYLEKIKLAEAMNRPSGGKALNAVFPFLLFSFISSSAGCSAANGFFTSASCGTMRY